MNNKWLKKIRNFRIIILITMHVSDFCRILRYRHKGASSEGCQLQGNCESNDHTNKMRDKTQRRLHVHVTAVDSSSILHDYAATVLWIAVCSINVIRFLRLYAIREQGIEIMCIPIASVGVMLFLRLVCLRQKNIIYNHQMCDFNFLALALVYTLGFSYINRWLISNFDLYDITGHVYLL